MKTNQKIAVAAAFAFLLAAFFLSETFAQEAQAEQSEEGGGEAQPAAFEYTNGPLRLQTGRWGQIERARG